MIFEGKTVTPAEAELLIMERAIAARTAGLVPTLHMSVGAVREWIEHTRPGRRFIVEDVVAPPYTPEEEAFARDHPVIPMHVDLDMAPDTAEVRFTPAQ